MADVVSPEKRSEMMSGIKGKNTKPEILVRKALYARGFRYRLHDAHLPGRPDIVFPKYGAAVFVNGCFWHMHGCHLSSIPKTRTEFWREKLEGNRARDAENIERLAEAGWRVAIVWECAIKGKKALPVEEIADMLENWLREGRNGTAFISVPS